MKKIYLAVLTAGVALSANAQRVATGTPVVLEGRTISSLETKVNRDTLVHDQFFNGTWSPTIYGVTNGGYIVGNNGYGDFQKAQSFIVGDLHPGVDHMVEGAVLWVGGMDLSSGNPASKAVVKVYALDGAGNDNSGPVNIAPGTVLASVDLPVSALDTVNFVEVSFPTPVLINAGTDYAIGIDLTTLAAGDTLGIVTTADGEFVLPETVWEQWNDNDWYTIPAAGWGLDLVSAIFAAVDLDVSSVNETSAVQMVQVNPNPARERVNFLFNSKMEGNMSLDIIDMTGKVIDHVELGNRSAGANKFVYDLSGINNGLYFYTLRNGSESVTGRLVVTK